MEEIEEYRHDLWNEVLELARDRDIYDQEAFFETACEILRDSEAITAYHPAYCRYLMGTNKALAIDGYDQDAFELDESIVVIVCDDKLTMNDQNAPQTIQAAECKKYFNAMQRFFVAAWNGSYQAQAEESSETYEFAQFIKQNRAGIRRARFYFITDREYTGRSDPEAIQIDQYKKEKERQHISWEYHTWDIRRLMEASHATGLAEHMSIELPGGIATVKAPDEMEDMDTYLLFVTGDVLSGWYKKYGSKLMEANVRSFLSMRGKVNKGIRTTICNQPDRFVAYNNGLTATATHVETDGQGRIIRLDDLQIVNGGQTTASIFYTGQKDKTDLSRVIVPVKLVVVHEDMARELVPYISRYTNSQNKVAEADFSSNSEYQIKLEQLSKQALTPPLPGTIQTHWYYERARGQYDSEKNRRDAASRKAFEKTNPSKQRIKMVDAPKYLVCWDGQPQVASLGAQKCFAKFVNQQSANKSAADELNVDFYKQLVCKRIIFDTVYKHIKKAEWFLGAYQANVAEYAVAKYSLDLRRAGLSCDFDAIWRRQSIDAHMLGCLLKAGEQASEVLNDPRRPVQNVSEWAKKDQCWNNLKGKMTCLDAADVEIVMEKPKHAATKRVVKEDEVSAAPEPRHKASNEAVEELPTDNVLVSDWHALTPKSLERLIAFATPKHYLSPKSKSSLETLISGDDLPINENALNNLLKRCLDAGFPLRELQAKPQVPLRPGIDITSEDASVDDRRDFLMSIPEQNWQTIIQWGQKRYMINQEMMAALARLSEGLQLTDRQTVLLWRLGNDMVKRGFPASLFKPRDQR